MQGPERVNIMGLVRRPSLPAPSNNVTENVIKPPRVLLLCTLITGWDATHLCT